jgi:hypothetical protein
MRPRNVTEGLRLHAAALFRLRVLYLLATATGLVLPIRCFVRAYPLLHALAKGGLASRGAALPADLEAE